VLHIELPPLRERREDIPQLVQSFMQQSAREHDRPPVALAPDTMSILMGYDWPGNVRELKNLVESMVVFAPGDVIQPRDIPPDIRNQIGRSRMLPVPIPRLDPDAPGAPPELEFIFRTLVELRIDVEELRRQFDEYRRVHPEFGPAAHMPFVLPPSRRPDAPVEIVADLPSPTPARPSPPEDVEDEHAVVVYRPGMTLEELERNAIVAALREVAGNRRKAAEMLGMGERTLYRKIKDYGIPL
jgi:DNA-binding NtrC family response regulator